MKKPTPPSQKVPAVRTFLTILAVMLLLLLPIPVLLNFGAEVLPRLGLAAALVAIPAGILFLAQRRAGGPGQLGVHQSK